MSPGVAKGFGKRFTTSGRPLPDKGTCMYGLKLSVNVSCRVTCCRIGILIATSFHEYLLQDSNEYFSLGKLG